MRARNLKPGFFKNEDLVDLPFEYRILFQGLWCLADREGKLEDRPVRIKMEIFPGDNVNIEDGLQKLHEKKLINRYINNDQKYIIIPTFKQHQNPHIKEKESVIPGPAPCKHQPRQVLASEIPERARLNPESPFPFPESPLLNPDSLYPGVPEKSWSRSLNKNGENKPDEEKFIGDKSLQSLGGWFETFWELFPKKKGRVETEQAWLEMKIDDDQAIEVLSALEKASRCWDWLKDGGRWIPKPSKWLLAKGWLDDYEACNQNLSVEEMQMRSMMLDDRKRKIKMREIKKAKESKKDFEMPPEHVSNEPPDFDADETREGGS